MEAQARKGDPLALLPGVPLLEIARQERVSNTAVENTIERLGISPNVTPTGRKTLKPADAVRIVEDIRSRASSRS